MKFFRAITAAGIFLAILCNVSFSQQGDGFVSIFDGKTLNGWTFLDGQTINGWLVEDADHDHWRAVNGILENTGEGKNSLIWTEKWYKDFILKIEFRLPGKAVEKLRTFYDYNGNRAIDENGKPVRAKVMDAGDSGLVFRCHPRAQVNIWSNPCGSGQIHGYMVDKKLPNKVRRSMIPFERADKPLGEWNSFVITMVGEKIKVVLNGKTIIDTILPGVPESGPFSVQQHGDGFPMQFRNIYIKELY